MNTLTKWIVNGIALLVATVGLMLAVYTGITITTEVGAEIQGWMASKPGEVRDVFSLFIGCLLVILLGVLVAMIRSTRHERKEKAELEAIAAAQTARQTWEAQQQVVEWTGKARAWQSKAEAWQVEAEKWKGLAEGWYEQNEGEPKPTPYKDDLATIAKGIRDGIFGKTTDLPSDMREK